MTFTLNSSPSHLLHRAQQIAANQSAAALKSAGVTLRQFSVLAALSGNEGVSQSDLVNATGIDRSTLADMVARMEGAGLIKRADSKTDARAKSVSLTAKGKKAYDKALPAVSKADEALFSTLAKAKQDALLQGLTGLVEDAEKRVAAPVKAPRAPKAPKAAAAPKVVKAAKAPKAVKGAKRKKAPAKAAVKAAPVARKTAK